MSGTVSGKVGNFKERLERAHTTLLTMADEASFKSDYDNQWRLEAKAEGVQLALSYLREYDWSEAPL